MSISIYALFSAAINIAFILLVYLLYLFRRKNGKSDTRAARISLVLASFMFPVLVTTVFTLIAMLAQRVYHYRIPVGAHGEGVFIILLSCVGASIASLMVLLPRIKHQWDDE